MYTAGTSTATPGTIIAAPGGLVPCDMIEVNPSNSPLDPLINNIYIVNDNH